jgi:hypothetical protein
VERIPSDQDQRLDDLGIVCESTYTLSGSFAPASAAPDAGECWPVGEWSITATLDFQGCDPQVEYGSPRRYVVTGNADDGYQFRYPADPDNPRIELGVVSHGGPDCEGQFDHFESDGSVWSLRPVLSPDGSISGTGSYALWIEDPYTN